MGDGDIQKLRAALARRERGRGKRYQCWPATRLLEPVYDALFQRLRAGPVIGVDQTGWPDLEDKTLPPWQMWCITAPGIVYHRICDDKSAATFEALLGDYRGWVVADALGTHEADARECRGIKLAACWAHVLRRFRDTVVDFPEAQLMLAWIGDDPLFTLVETAKGLASTRSPTSSRPPPAPSARPAPCSCLQTSKPPRGRRHPYHRRPSSSGRLRRGDTFRT